jgi:hypothetical protein
MQKYIIKRRLGLFGNNNLQKLANKGPNFPNQLEKQNNFQIICGIRGFCFADALPSYETGTSPLGSRF